MIHDLSQKHSFVHRAWEIIPDIYSMTTDYFLNEYSFSNIVAQEIARKAGFELQVGSCVCKIWDKVTALPKASFPQQ